MCCIRKEGFEVLAGGYKVFLRHVSLITTVSYAPSHNSEFTRRVHLIMSVCCARTVQNDSCKHHMESTWDGPHCSEYERIWSIFLSFFFFFWPPNLCTALVISPYLQIGPDGSANWRSGGWPRRWKPSVAPSRLLYRYLILPSCKYPLNPPFTPSSRCILYKIQPVIFL